MSRLTSFTMRVLSWPLETVRRHAHANAISREWSEESDVQPEAERLERIAMYARAGYFNTGYTSGMYPSAGELPPD